MKWDPKLEPPRFGITSRRRREREQREREKRKERKRYDDYVCCLECWW